MRSYRGRCHSRMTGSAKLVVDMVKSIFLLFLIWRLLLFIPLLAGYQFLSYRPDADYTNIWKFIKPYSPVDHPLLYPWANFDGVHYLSIAASGYQDNERFLPAFPLLIRFFTALFGGGEPYSAIYFFTAIGIVHLLFFASLVLLYKLVRIDFSEKVAFASVVFLLVFPASFFYVSIYSESLFLFLTLSSFYLARKQLWFGAGITGMFLSATRIVGIAILPSLLYEFLKQKKKWSLKSVPLFFVPLGLLVYALFNF